MNGAGRLPKQEMECNEGAPTSLNGMKKLWWRYSSSVQRVSPPPRFLLVVLLGVQILFLAMVRLGPSSITWGSQGAGSSVQVSSNSQTSLSRISVFLSDTFLESQAISRKESKASSKPSSSSPKQHARQKEKPTSKQRATTKKMLMKESMHSETEKTSNVGLLDKQKGSVVAVSEDVEDRPNAKEQFDELLPAVDEKFLVDTAIKQTLNADTSVKKKGEQQEGPTPAGYVETAFSSTRKVQSKPRGRRKHRRNASKIKQVVAEAEAQTEPDQENEGESTFVDKESLRDLEREQQVPLAEKTEEAAIDASVENQAMELEVKPVAVEGATATSLTKVAKEDHPPKDAKKEQQAPSATKVDKAATELSVEHHTTKQEVQSLAADEVNESAASMPKVVGEEPLRDAEKEQQAPSATKVEEAATEVSVEHRTTKQEVQTLAAAEEVNESAASMTKVVEKEGLAKESQVTTSGKESEHLVKKEAALVDQKVNEGMSSSECSYGYIYVYDLPPAFNRDIIFNCSALNPWFDVCSTLSNGGLGGSLGATSPLGQEGSWYNSDHVTAEIVFHNRILQHACLTDKMDMASAFYVPFYAGLDVGRYFVSGASVESRDMLSNQFLEWLIEQPAWKMRGGLDHFMMIGRVTWDFRRSRNEDWGSGFFNKPAMQNVTKLLIERNPWDNKEMAVPYPTNFHPQSDADLVAWQNHLKGLKRNKLFSFAGAPKDRFPDDFRHILFEQCKQAEQCGSLDCSNGACGDNQKTLEFFMDSTFCLQPRGDSFTRRSTFDCLLAGSIPVFFWHRSAYMQYEWHLPAAEESYSVFISKQDVRNGTKIEDVLKAIIPEKVQSMQEAVIQLIPKVVYAVSGFALKEKDAFDVAMEGVMRSLKGPSVSLQR